ncbi:MAG: ATP-binding protein [Elusimicrobiaceae bacterium]|nr:ATP-binding protein [Elusimicrobiaceae bacterium]
MPDQTADANLLARVTIKAERNFLPLVTGFVRGLALEKGLAADQADGLENVTEEACLNVIDHAFSAGTDAYFSVSVERPPGQLVVAIEDYGLPLDWKKLRSGQGMGLGMLLMKAFTDEVRFVNLENNGKRLELVKNISSAPLAPALSEECFYNVPAALPDAAGAGPAAASAVTEIRLLASDEGVKLARLFYKNREYNYEDDVFFPEKISELVDSGLMTSAVAVLADGEFAAHMAIMKKRKDSFVGETGLSALDPVCRSAGLLEPLKRKLIEQARRDEMYGLYSETGLADVASRRINMTLGAKETGVLLGCLAGEDGGARHAALLTYIRIGEEPHRIIRPPFHHRTMISKIYANLGFSRQADSFAPPAAVLRPGDTSRLETRIVPETGLGYITVLHYGPDFQDAVITQQMELLRHRLGCIYLDLPLANPATPELCGAAELLGFFFAGVIPETSSGDMLRLQYLARPDCGYPQMEAVTEFGAELYDYVLGMAPVK